VETPSTRAIVVIWNSAWHALMNLVRCTNGDEVHCRFHHRDRIVEFL